MNPADNVFSVIIKLAGFLRSLLRRDRCLSGKVFPDRSSAVSCSSGDLADTQISVE